MTLLVSSLIYVSLLMLLAVISATETAIHMARELDVQTAVAGNAGVAQKLRRIRANPFLQLYRTLLLSATLNLALAASGLFIVTGPLREMGLHPWGSAAVLFMVTVLCGDVLPKFLAARSPTSVLMGSLRLLGPLRGVLDPLASFADRTTDVILEKVVPQRVKTRTPMTRDEFETLVEMRQEQGLLDTAEADVIREVLDVEELTVRDCMIPRVDLPLIDSQDADEKITGLLEKAPLRFVIIYRDRPDMVEGVVDVVAWKLAGRPDWRAVMRSAPFVPETMPILDALAEHLQDPAQPLLIADEYGGLEGLVSQEQIADWLLCEAAPWNGEAAEIRDLGGGRYLLDGGTRLDDIAEELGVEISETGVDTVGGWVFNHLGYVPKAGERISLPKVDLKVRRVVKARVVQVEMRLKNLQVEATA